MRIAALDDKLEWLQLEQKISEDYCQKRGKTLEFKGYLDVPSFLNDLENKEKFDIYLLDVEMPVADGLHVATEIKKKCAEPIIIYITDFPQYAPRGYEVNAYRYILKEQVSLKLPEAFDSLLPRLEEVANTYYVVVNSTGMEQILQENIYYIKKEKKYVFLMTEEGEKRERKTLQEVENSLHKDDFMLIDKGVMVNLRHVMKLEGDWIKMRDETRFFISRPRQKIVKQRIMEYWGKRI